MSAHMWIYHLCESMLKDRRNCSGLWPWQLWQSPLFREKKVCFPVLAASSNFSVPHTGGGGSSTLLTTVLQVSEQAREQVVHFWVHTFPLTMWVGLVWPLHRSSLYLWRHPAAARVSDPEWPMLSAERFSALGAFTPDSGVQDGFQDEERGLLRASEHKALSRLKGQEGSLRRGHLELGQQCK